MEPFLGWLGLDEIMVPAVTSKQLPGHSGVGSNAATTASPAHFPTSVCTDLVLLSVLHLPPYCIRHVSGETLRSVGCHYVETKYLLVP